MENILLTGEKFCLTFRYDHQKEAAEMFADLLNEGSYIEDRKVGREEQDIKGLLAHQTFADAIKLFANTYLVLHVSCFIGIDTYIQTKGLDTRQIIEGICKDPRIGSRYKPSLGYSGYCPPKNTKQLLANYRAITQTMIEAVINGNKRYFSWRCDSQSVMN